jgi:2-C-methyl-D-erythritol 4-phosphate cytidylyltransferase
VTGHGLTGCVVVAGGRGERLGLAVPKGLAEVGGRPLVQHAVEAVLASDVVDVVVVVVPAGAQDDVRALLPPGVFVVAGGATRRSSVQAGLVHLPAGVDAVLVHDAARALAPPELVADVVRAVRAGHHAVVPGVELADTVRHVDGEVVDRSTLVAVQTPQGFARGLLDRAHTCAPDGSWTDDAGLVERLGVQVRVVEGHAEAFKVTHPLDLVLAEAVLARRAAGSPR